MQNRRSFLTALFTGALAASVPVVVQANPVVDIKVSFFGEQPGDEEGSIVLQDIHADGSYSVRQQLFYGEHV